MTDRTLDIQCAEALGYQVGYRPQNIVIAGEDPSALVQTKGAWESSEPLRGYSTDPATLDEKVAWLANLGNVEITRWASNGEVGAELYGSDRHRFDNVRCGWNIHEATARLVVAVAGKIKEQA